MRGSTLGSFCSYCIFSSASAGVFGISGDTSDCLAMRSLEPSGGASDSAEVDQGYPHLSAATNGLVMKRRGGVLLKLVVQWQPQRDILLRVVLPTRCGCCR